jgi:hypothetical protein
MYVEFADNAVYEYRAGPPEIFRAFLRAPSHGRYARANIYYSFRYRRCHEPNQPYRGGPGIPPGERAYLGA